LTLWAKGDRMVFRPRPLSETDCYCRCYGPGPGSVRIIRLERQPRRGSRLSGEALRRLFEERLDAREPDAVYESEAA
jgi:hypothetical protein